MALHSQLFDAKNNAFNISNKNYKIGYYKEMQSYRNPNEILKHDKANITEGPVDFSKPSHPYCSRKTWCSSPKMGPEGSPFLYHYGKGIYLAVTDEKVVLAFSTNTAVGNIKARMSGMQPDAGYFN